MQLPCALYWRVRLPPRVPSGGIALFGRWLDGAPRRWDDAAHRRSAYGRPAYGRAAADHRANRQPAGSAGRAWEGSGRYGMHWGTLVTVVLLLAGACAPS